MAVESGIFTISLDFELYWGVRDKRTVLEYDANLRGVKPAINRMLELFHKYEIHATWATVGLLFAQNIQELKAILPRKTPSYLNTNLDPYAYIEKNNALENEYHFASEIVEQIRKYRNQEVGTHTFSHYYCLENGQTADEFNSDLECAIKIAKAKDIPIKSLVFPRNQWNPKYLSLLKNHGLTSYRGNQKSWLYKAIDETEEKLVRRGLRLMDAYFNLSGPNSYNIKSIGTQKPYNIPSSRFLYPISKKLAVFQGLKKRRIVNSLKHAAKNKEIFHLWWHPHNFGVNTEKNMKFLEEILSTFSQLKKQYDMKSLNMDEISQLVARSEEL